MTVPSDLCDLIRSHWISSRYDNPPLTIKASPLNKVARLLCLFIIILEEEIAIVYDASLLVELLNEQAGCLRGLHLELLLDSLLIELHTFAG